jgi:hypothetical protein
MLTDNELTTRLQAAFRETVAKMEYGGVVPHVRHHARLATTSVLAGAVATAAVAAGALAPAAVQQDQHRTPDAAPSLRPGTRHSQPAGRTMTHTVGFGSLRLTYASVDGIPGPLSFTGGPHLRLPANAEKLMNLNLPVDVWYAPDAAAGQPDAYTRPRGGCPDTVKGCTPGYRPPLIGLLAPGWTRHQLIHLFEHPVQTQRDLR